MAINFVDGKYVHADGHVTLALRQKSQSGGHGRVLLGADDTDRIVLHRDNGIGMHDAEAADIVALVARRLLYYFAVTHKYEIGVVLTVGGKNSAQYFERGVIAAHRVNDNSHKKASLSDTFVSY